MTRPVTPVTLKSHTQLEFFVPNSRQLKAFIWDSSRLEYEAARDCDLITAGDLFGRSGYGVGLQKGSPWADKITLAILDFHESGQMEELGNIIH